MEFNIDEEAEFLKSYESVKRSELNTMFHNLYETLDNNGAVGFEPENVNKAENVKKLRKMVNELFYELSSEFRKQLRNNVMEDMNEKLFKNLKDNILNEFPVRNRGTIGIQNYENEVHNIVSEAFFAIKSKYNKYKDEINIIKEKSNPKEVSPFALDEEISLLNFGETNFIKTENISSENEVLPYEISDINLKNVEELLGNFNSKIANSQSINALNAQGILYSSGVAGELSKLLYSDEVLKLQSEISQFCNCPQIFNISMDDHYEIVPVHIMNADELSKQKVEFLNSYPQLSSSINKLFNHYNNISNSYFSYIDKNRKIDSSETAGKLGAVLS